MEGGGGDDLLPEDDDLLSYFLTQENLAAAAATYRRSATHPSSVDTSLLSSAARLQLDPRSPHAAASAFEPNNASGSVLPSFAVAGGQAASSVGASAGLLEGQNSENGPSRTLGARRSSSGEHRDSMSGSSGGRDTEDERRQRRLARNRESARQSRRRKKQYLELLEEKVAQLTDELDHVRRKHLSEAGAELDNVRRQLLEKLAEKLESSPQAGTTREAVEEELRAELDRIHRQTGPNCKERQVVVDFHFQHLSTVILPPFTRFLMWMSAQDDDFFASSGAQSRKSAAAALQAAAARTGEGPGGPGGAAAGTGGAPAGTTASTPGTPTATTAVMETPGQQNAVVEGGETLWPVLSCELGLTFEQEEKLKAFFRQGGGGGGRATRGDRHKLAVAMVYLYRLKRNMEERARAVDKLHHSVAQILTPEQRVKYENWVEKNRDKLANCGLDSQANVAGSATSMNGGEQTGERRARSNVLEEILRKDDAELTVEDVTTLLQSMAKRG